MKTIDYRIVPAFPEAHLYEITCSIPTPDPNGQVLGLPAWIPGSYMIRDFAKNIVTFEAESGGQPVTVEAIDKQTWRCAPCDGPLTITYQVYAWDLSVRTAHLDTTHAYFNGTSVFISPRGFENNPCRVEIKLPDGDEYQHWRVSTAMARDGAELHYAGWYKAGSYDELIDHPVEIGDFSLATFEVAGVPHDIVITGRHRADMDRLCQDLQTICQHHIDLFGELPFMERYVFQVMAVGDGYGGLEHRASTSLLCSRNDLPQVGLAEVTDKYRAFLGLCSHEYFHTWNVKRIKPDVFMDYDLSQESYTHLMWMFEGITSYYDDLSLVRTGLIDSQSYLDLLAQIITRVIRGSGQQKQTVWDSSFYTWTKFYKQDENAPNAIVSYYAKGALIALGLDLSIRHKSQGKKSLDDVMRYLWNQYGKAGKGVNEQTIEQEIAEHVDVDLTEFFDRFLRTTQELPFMVWLQTVGVEYRLVQAASSKDPGGKQKRTDESRNSLGARIKGAAEGVLLTHVLDSGMAQLAGLSAGDTLIAIDGIRISADSLDGRLAEYSEGECMTLHAFRRDELMEFQAVVQAAPLDTCVLALVGEQPAWLRGD